MQKTSLQTLPTKINNSSSLYLVDNTKTHKTKERISNSYFTQSGRDQLDLITMTSSLLPKQRHLVKPLDKQSFHKQIMASSENRFAALQEEG
jgi:hypothetical protein